MVTWHRFDYEDKDNTAPPHFETVWLVEDFYCEGVTLGFFDGFTFETFDAGDDCRVRYWARIDYPEPPKDWSIDGV